MNIQGTVIAVLPAKSGTSQSGKAWQRQTFVVQTHEQYPKSIALNVMNDRVQQFAVKQGEEVSVDFDIDAHEYQGNWYNDIKAWQLTKLGGVAQQTQQTVFPGQPTPIGTPNPYAVATAGMTQQPAATATAVPQGDDLPF